MAVSPFKAPSRIQSALLQNILIGIVAVTAEPRGEFVVSMCPAQVAS